MSKQEHEPSQDSLEEWLQLKEPYIEDGGFTAQVIAGLPPPRARREHRRMFVLAMFFALAFALAFILFPGIQQVTLALVEITRFERFSSEWPVAPLAVIGLLVWGSMMAAWSEG